MGNRSSNENTEFTYINERSDQNNADLQRIAELIDSFDEELKNLELEVSCAIW